MAVSAALDHIIITAFRHCEMTAGIACTEIAQKCTNIVFRIRLSVDCNGENIPDRCISDVNIAHIFLRYSQPPAFAVKIDVRFIWIYDAAKIWHSGLGPDVFGIFRRTAVSCKIVNSAKLPVIADKLSCCFRYGPIGFFGCTAQTAINLTACIVGEIKTIAAEFVQICQCISSRNNRLRLQSLQRPVRRHLVGKNTFRVILKLNVIHHRQILTGQTGKLEIAVIGIISALGYCLISGYGRQRQRISRTAVKQKQNLLRIRAQN